jgi:hypothetical protein
MDEETKPQRKAKHNPWYRLATFHGVPSRPGDEIARKNRVTWNRWMASRISDELKTVLRGKGWSDEELTPFSEDELHTTEARVKSSLDVKFGIDFQETEFEEGFVAAGFVFPHISFGGAVFRGGSEFYEAVFSDEADFSSAILHAPTSSERHSLALLNSGAPSSSALPFSPRRPSAAPLISTAQISVASLSSSVWPSAATPGSAGRASAMHSTLRALSSAELPFATAPTSAKQRLLASYVS